jgi:hypothetical protein
MYFGSHERAERLWLQACENRDGLGCFRLMSVAAVEPALADRLGLLACEYGEGDACEFAAKSLFVRSKAHFKDEDPESLAQAARSLVAAQCQAGYWWSCVMALETTQDRKSEAAQQLARRAFELAPRDCRRGDVSACYYGATQYERAGELAPAKHLYAIGCGLLKSGGLSSTFGRGASTTVVCQRARQLGADVENAKPAPRPGYAQLKTQDLRGRRLSGDIDVSPPNKVKDAMARVRARSVAMVGSLRFCVTTSGLVADVGFNLSTGSASYDRKLLDSVRQWRYRPYVDGAPKPFCSAVTFIYRQTRW